MRLLKIEWIPIRHNKSIWIMLGLYMVLFALLSYAFDKFEFNAGGEGAMLLSQFNLLKFPDVWPNLAYLGSFFNLILAFIVIMLVTNEFSYRTLRQHLIDGLTRVEFLAGKLMVIGVLSLTLTVFLGIISLILGSVNSPSGAIPWTEGSEFLGAFFIQTLGYLVMAMFFGLLLRKAIFSIGLFLLYSWLIENLPGWITGFEIFDYLPGNAMDELIPSPFTRYLVSETAPQLPLASLVATVVWIGVFAGASYLLISKRDL